MALRVPSLESAAALGACAVASLLASRRLLRPDVYSDDAFVHQYWMRRFEDPQLFTDPLTAQLRESARYPEGYEALFRLASRLAEPIAFGEWLGVALMALSGWLIFAIVREHTAWRPAAWIAAGLFLALIDIHRFHGGFARAFVHPVVLLTVLLALRRHHLGAALVAAGGALFYPPAALLALGVLIVSAVRWTDRRPRLEGRRAALAGLALVLAIAIVLGPQLAGGGAPRVLTADEARMFGEFGPRGPLHFFAASPVEYLTQNRSGFDLRTSGSLLALAALALLLLRPASLRLLRTEVLALPVVALAAFGLAQAVLFKLYLPHRYTYPLVAFFAIAVGVAIGPAWTALWARLRPRAAASVAPAAAAVLTGVALLAVLVAVSSRETRGSTCPTGPVTGYLASLPKDAIIAGDPSDLKCLPATARRAVVISTQLAPSYEVEYFLAGRARMFATLRAYYGPSAGAIADLRERYGATHLWVRRDAVRREMAGEGVRWRAGRLPYGRFVRQIASSGAAPAVLGLPGACRRWRNGPVEVYDVRCIAADIARTARARHSAGTRRL